MATKIRGPDVPRFFPLGHPNSLVYHTCTCSTDDLKENIHNAAATDITPQSLVCGQYMWQQY